MGNDKFTLFILQDQSELFDYTSYLHKSATARELLLSSALNL